MNCLRWILAFVFDCAHRRTTWPHRDSRGHDYVCCLDCGRELPYSTQRMRIVTEDEPLEDRTFDTRQGLLRPRWSWNLERGGR
jgi:hypothetical protein